MEDQDNGMQEVRAFIEHFSDIIGQTLEYVSKYKCMNIMYKCLARLWGSTLL